MKRNWAKMEDVFKEWPWEPVWCQRLQQGGIQKSPETPVTIK
jgi:hypothetical protein